MYALLFAFFILGGQWRGVPATPHWWGFLHYVAVNLFAFWISFRPGWVERAVRALVVLDLGLICACASYILLLNLVAFREPQSAGTALGLMALAGLTFALCRRVYLDLPFTKWLLPVRGQWARRFSAGVAVLLLQLFSPAMLAAVVITFAGAGAFAAGSAEHEAYRIGGTLCLMTAPLYLAPVYRLLVAGKITALPAALDPSLLFGEHQALHPDDAAAFARLVARLELPLQEHLSRSGHYPYEAAAMARECLLDLWQTGHAARYDNLSFGDLPVLAAAALKQAPVPMPTLEPNELWTNRALDALPDASREPARQWLRDPDSFSWLVRTRGESEVEVATTLRTALNDILTTIAADLPPREETLRG